MSVIVKQTVNECWQPLFIKRGGVRYVIIMGGRGAGRSYVASQFALAKLIAPDYFRCAIMRLVHSDIRNSIYQEIIDRVDAQGVTNNIRINDSDMKFRYTVKKKDADGKKIEQVNRITALGFRTSDKSQSAKLKSLASYNTVIIEEAEEIGEAEFMQLDDSLRTTEGEITVVLCLNTPPKNHWIIRRWFDLEPVVQAPGFNKPVLKPECADDTEFLYFDYRSNLNNLDAHTIKRYENYKNTNPDYYWHKIRGFSPDVVRGKIYSGWKLIDEIPHEARLVGRGLDFGWYPDPLHLCNVYYYDGGYILDQLLHGTHIKLEDVALTIKNDDKNNQRALTVADSAEPRSIENIADHQVNIIGATKGQGSVEHRIKIVGSLRVSVTRRSKDLWDGYETYAYKEDKDGNSLGVPAHKGSDPMDAAGYCLVEVLDEMDPEQEQKERIRHQVDHVNFVNMAQQRHGL